MTTSATDKISDQFCFDPVHATIKQTQEALKLHKDRLQNASNLADDIPIFLDANVLLNYYKISFTERSELLKFFDKNKQRIYLTKQIEIEFLKHRVDHIKSYLKSVEEFVHLYRNIKSEIERLKLGEIKGFDHFLTSNNILKNDYPKLRDELSDFNETLKEKLKELFQTNDFDNQIKEKEKTIEDIKSHLENQADIERKDPLLEIISEFNVVENLDAEEIDFLKKLYDKLNNNYKEIKGDQNHNWKHTFPGCGEKKEYPYGDFFIFHEILKFMKSNETGVIFLTNDVEKNDWLLRKNADLLPYSHYIVNTYIATSQTVHVFQAKDKIRVSYQPVFEDEKVESIDTKIEKESKEVKEASNPLSNTDNSEIEFSAMLEQFEREYEWFHKGSENQAFQYISDDEFLYELFQSQKWARDYGDNFVGLRSFIVKYLGSKHYDFKTSYNVKDNLLENGLVEIYTHKSNNDFFSDVEAVKLTQKGENIAQNPRIISNW